MLQSVGFVCVMMFFFLFVPQKSLCQSDVSREQSSSREVSEQAQQRARDTAGFKNMMHIGMALHNYHEIFGRFPPAILYGTDGTTPYSWRVELLPVLNLDIFRNQIRANMSRDDYASLIMECGYDVNAPWDSDINAKILNRMPKVYRHPSEPETCNEAACYAITGTGTTFETEHVSVIFTKDYKLNDWVSSTLALVESRSREPWTKPVDILYSKDATVPRFGGFTDGGALGVTCDGAVHFLDDSIRPDDLRALMTRTLEDTFSIPGIPIDQ